MRSVKYILYSSREFNISRLIKLFFFIKWWFGSNKFALLQLCFMIVFQFKGIAFISSIPEKYKLSASLNSVFKTFHDLKFPKESSKLFIKLTFLSGKDDR